MAITKTRRIITELALLFAVAVVAAWVGSLSSAPWPTVAAASASATPAHVSLASKGPNNTIWG